ncbi:magnesium transporter [Haloferula rosea]|uniref:Magnesium transporter MgtE n=1 Tax=Haloferula rosea TaxID=490093 RepID=A0A934VFU5_9BACT|nr:magnesium transporter [Haloferula rosea]MBK1828724.1 magnesium transporter [Haloferula rosea]
MVNIPVDDSVESIEQPVDERPWEILAEKLEAEDHAGAAALLSDLSVEDQRLAMAHLAEGSQVILTSSLPPQEAAEMLEILPEAQAVSILNQLPSEAAADIVEMLPGSIGSDLLREMDEEDSDAVLAELDDPDEAEKLRTRVEYEWDTAGGLMRTRLASFSETATVGDVLADLGENAESYADMDVQYVYVTGEGEKLRGVLRLRDLVLTPRKTPVSKVMISDPVCVKASDNFSSLRTLFDEKNYIGLPVVEEDGSLIGVITRQAVREATSEHQTEDFLHTQGILGGEELRSMPMVARCGRRLAWLGPNIILNLVAASVIAMYEDTLQAVIALAVFLPIVSDMSGCSGNQAVAVSIRELTLGLIRPTEFLRIVWKEGILGIVNGFVLGLLLGTIAAVWKGNIYLGLVVGGALFLNTILSVLLGGMVPLFLKRLKVDPALASGPILTTCTDMCGFFLVLNLASAVLSKLG